MPNMNQQLYDMMLTVFLFLCGLLGMIYSVEHGQGMGFAIASMVVLVMTLFYTYLIEKFISMPDRSDYKYLVRYGCESSQKIAMLAVVVQCFIILASS